MTVSARPPRFRSTPSLSSTFAPPATRTNGRSTSPSKRSEVLELGQQEQTGIRGQQVRDRLRRGVRAVRRPEGVVDVELHAFRELPRGRGVVRRLAREEARVLEHPKPLVRKELGEPCRDGRDREGGIRSLGPAEVGAHDDLGGTALEEQLERRQRGPDPRVVGDLPVLERDVEVAADEDALAVDVGGLDGAWEPHRTPGVRLQVGHLRFRRVTAAAARRDRPADTSTPTRCRTSRRPWRCGPGPSSAGCRRCTSCGFPTMSVETSGSSV